MQASKANRQAISVFRQSPYERQGFWPFSDTDDSSPSSDIPGSETPKKARPVCKSAFEFQDSDNEKTRKRQIRENQT
ncbi:hypothetical protein L596_012685 [Steinernema carpocapsae]|uniref:Uncharacterized protein n=1 Tax=Steinernema carpocapsae TaxID=34508 RepID=A0A4U5NXZ2_STECR|nr:hypothetical protein L596_012685 [Steinernema carpocapsae]